MKVYIGRYPKDHTKERTIRVRIDKYDSWSLDHTLALIIAPALRAFKEDKSLGTPGSFFPADYDWALGTDDAEDKRVSEEAHARWIETIDKMIFAFDAVANGDWEAQFFTHPESDEGAYEDSESFNAHLAKIKIDREGLEAYEKRIQEGLELFGKYFRNLWT